MTLRVAGKNFDIGEALRHHIVDRINQMGSKYLNASMTGLIVIDHEGNGYKSDCTLHMKAGTSLHSDGISHDPYVSFDQAADRLEKRLRRHKQRLQSHQSSHHAAPQPIAGTIADYVFDQFNPLIIAERSTDLKKMAVSDAVTELDLTGAPVLVFCHAGSGRVNLVYRRMDGNIGWIDPTEVKN
jgi:ribosomal subunit interface protein